ncbi:class A beta-lactamase [Streptomyces sp. NPDC049555]|uniref:class A beta-lactamase n=1 Tax=Streptomyces sp. NPDC049555 TaxID=3154930 RepID=UPI003424E43C
MTSIPRRNALTLGAGAALATVLAGSGTAHAATPHRSDNRDAARRLAALERAHGARLGVYAHNVRTGRTVAHSADELFPMCSTFKTLAVAAVLRDLDRDGEFLAKRIRYTAQDVTDAENSDVTGREVNIANGMTVAELCDAAITFSDNCAANLLLRELGGPTAVTRFARSVGDRVTRLDRWEPALNTAEPDRVTDTTSPYAIGRTYARLVLGDALAAADRRRLTGWLLANTTSGERFRKGIPAGWTVADKTGGGSYGTNNDVGVVWTPQGAPVVMAVLTTHPRDQKAKGDNALIAETVAVLADALG